MAHPIQKAAVLGAGVMGASIAGLLAGAGIEVDLLDIVPEGAQLPQERDKLAQDAKNLLIKGKGLYNKATANRIFCGNLEDHLYRLDSADWVLEAVVENLEIKRSLYKRISSHIVPHAVITSNTSGISIEAMAESLPEDMRSRFLGIHFFNPPRYMKLVELIPTPYTKPVITASMSEFIQQRLGKGIIVAKDTPNFIANRIGVFASANSMQLGLRHGLNFMEVDHYTDTFIGRNPSGTFRTTDLVGLDTTALVVQSVQRAVPDAEMHYFDLPVYFKDLTDQGRLGNKNGAGFYKRVKEPVRTTLMWSPEKQEYISYTLDPPAWETALPKKSTAATAILAARSSGTPSGTFVWETVRDTILYAAWQVGEITDDFRKIDLALQWGYNWKMGPFALWDSMGTQETIDLFAAEGKEVPPWVNDHLKKSGGTFFNEDRYVGLMPAIITVAEQKVVRQAEGVRLVDIGDEVALLALESKGNSINSLIVEEIREMLTLVKADFTAMVIGNDGRNFSAGASLGDIAALAKERKTQELNKNINSFQDMMMDIKYLGKPVVSAPFNQTLGGGCELCLHSTAVLANIETYMGLVEVGVGLIPSGGGTKEMAIRAAQWGEVAAGGDFLSALKAYSDNITMAKVTKSALEGFDLGFLRSTDRVNMDKLTLIREAKEMALGLLPGYRPMVHQSYKVLGSTGWAAMKVQVDNMLEGGWISEFDAFIALEVTRVICGGDVPSGTMVSEQELLDLERSTFLMLAGQEKTQARIAHMLETGKPLRN